MHESTVLTFKSKMAAGLTPVWENTYIVCTSSAIIIMLEFIHRFWESMNPFIRFSFCLGHHVMQSIKYYSKSRIYSRTSRGKKVGSQCEVENLYFLPVTTVNYYILKL